MEDEIDLRKTRYEQMSTQELLELHASGMLGNMAYDVLESELRGRGVTVPSRPKGEETLAEANNTENGKAKQSYQYIIMLPWISPLTGFIVLLVMFLRVISDPLRALAANVTLVGMSVMFILLSIVAGALLTTWGFVVRKRYPNAIKHAIIGLVANMILLFAIGLFLLILGAMGMSGKFGY